MTVFILLLCFGIGFVTGLRSMTGIALVCWGAHLGWLNLHGTKLGFLASVISLIVFSLFAVAELVADKLPVPPRTSPGPLIARIVFGALCACALAVAAGVSNWVLALVLPGTFGAVGALAGTFGGYWARRLLVPRLGIGDLPVALTEDAVTILLGLLMVSRY